MDLLTQQSVRSPAPQGPPNRLTGLRWGELIALKAHHLDLSKRTSKVDESVVEMSIKNSPTGARMLTKPYPKDNEAHPEQDSRATRGAAEREHSDIRPDTPSTATSRTTSKRQST